MKKTVKTSILAVTYVLIFISIYVYIAILLTPKEEDDFGGALFYQGVGFMAEPKNSLDVLFFGNSSVYSGITPIEIYENYNITSYASGRGRQSLQGAEQFLKSALKTQNPSVVVLETDCVFYTDNAFANLSTSPLAFLASPFMYHAKWKSLKPKDFYTFPNTKKVERPLKGYRFESKEYNFNPGNFMGDKNNKSRKLSKKELTSLNSIVKLCKKKGIQLMLLELPNAHSWNYAKHNAISEFATHNKLKFVDMNIDTLEKYKVDWKTGFWDKGTHLNIKGATAASNYIGEYITKNFKLNNKGHSDKTKNSWKKSLEKYKNQYKKDKAEK